MDANSGPGAPPAGPHLLTVCGSLQATSANRAALDAATVVAVAAGALVEDVGLLAEIPPFNADLADAGIAAVEAWRHQVAAADAVLIATPEYAGGVAGVVKNAFDWLVGSGELYRRPVAVLSAATSGGLEARRMLAQSLTWQGAYVVAQLGIAAPRTKFDMSARQDGRPTDPHTAAAISSLTHQLLAAAAPGTDVVARAVEVVGALGVDVAHVAPAGWTATSTGAPEPADEALPATLRAVPSGPARDRYLPLFHLADDSREQVRGYYQTGTLLALDDDDGNPVGIVLVIDPAGATTTAEPAERVAELKAVAVTESRQRRGVGRHLLAATLRHLRAGGVSRVMVGTASSGTGQLAFYQKAGFRLDRVERDYFTPSRGYAPGIVEDGIPLRDMVWMDQRLPPPDGGKAPA